MFNKVSYSVDDKTRLVTFSCWVGRRFKKSIEKIGYSSIKQKYLFTSISMNGFSVNRFFIPDIRYICETLIDKGSAYGVNVVALSNIIDIIDKNFTTSYKDTHKLDMEYVKTIFKFSPTKTQMPAYDKYSEIRSINGSRGALLDGAVGVGKTYVSLSIAAALHSEVTLIVAPLPTVDKVWVNSFIGEGILYKIPQKHYVMGSEKEYSAEQFVICHYERLKYIVEFYKKYNINFSTIIVDEVHNFNDVKSTRTKLLIDVVDSIPFKNAIPMSGTPIKARPIDLVPLLKIINSDFTNTVMSRFIKLYQGRSRSMMTVMKARYQSYTIVLRKNDMDIPPISTFTTKNKIRNGDNYTLENISKRLKKYMEDREEYLVNNYDGYEKTYLDLYNTAKDAGIVLSIAKKTDYARYEGNIRIIVKSYSNNNLMNIPDVIRDANVFERKYIETQLHGIDKKNFREAKTVYKYIRLKVQGEALANVVMKARIDCYTELAGAKDRILSYINSSTKKTLVFSNYVSVCDAVINVCKINKLTPIGIYGDSSKLLTKNVNIFTVNTNINPLVTTYKSLSTGVPLTVANVIIIYGLPHRQYIFDQTIGRAWRTGQDKPVSVYIVELDTGDKPNITDRDFDIITFFREEVSKLTGNTDAVIIDKSSVQEELSIDDFYRKSDNVLSSMFKTTTDVIRTWL